MTYVWPEDIIPFGAAFYLQPHTGGSESPFSRVTKVYGLSPPRWVCSLSFRAPDSQDRWGEGDFSDWGERMDAFLAKLEGRLNRCLLWDFRRPGRAVLFSNGAVTAGDSEITLIGASVGDIRVGEYLGGDGRPHIITDIRADGSDLVATVKPPFSMSVAAGASTFQNVSGYFRLTSDDAGSNPAQVGELTPYNLDFVEDWHNPLHGLAPTVLNLTDGDDPIYTLAETADGIDLSAISFNKRLLFSTEITPARPQARLLLTIKPTGTTSIQLGMAFVDADGNHQILAWQQNGWFRSIVNGTNTTISTTVPTYAPGDTLLMQYDITQDGEVYVTISKNGGVRKAFGVTGAAVGDAYLFMFDDGGDAAASFSLLEQPVTAFENTWSPVSEGEPTGWVERLPPSGFTMPRLPTGARFWRHPTIEDQFTTNIDISQPMLSAADPTVFVQYVDIAAGNDTYAATMGAPLKSLVQAKLNAGIGTRAIIRAKGGLYDYANSFGSGSPAAAQIQIESWDGEPVISSMHDAGLVWTLESGATWQATFTNEVVNVFDALNLTADGHYSPLSLAASLVACRATAGSYYVSGTTVYVHMIDGGSAYPGARVYKRAADGSAEFNAHFSGPDAVYIGENIGFEGGESAYWMDTNGAPLTDQQDVYGYRCWFKYSGPNLAVAPYLNGDILGVWQEVTSALNAGDGFHYNPISSSAPASGIEIDCLANWNGIGNGVGGSANNSSNHSGATIRIRTKPLADGYGDYKSAENRGIHDIKDITISQSARSWCMGLTSRDSRSGNSNFGCGSGNVGDVSKMWLDGCISSGATYDLEVFSGATIYTHNFTGSASNTGAGTITSYTP